MNAQTFDTFLSMDLASNLPPFDGLNPRSVIIMDNASIHHVEGFWRTLEFWFIFFLLIVRTITQLFSKVKYIMKANEFNSNDEDMETLILSGFSSVTPLDCQKWIEHYEIY